MNRILKVAAVALACAGLAACGTVGRLWPFGGDKEGPEASEGERISIIAFDQKVTPAEALAGIDFYVPDARPVPEWPLPGGTPDQAPEHVEAAPAFQIAWRRGIGEGSDRGRHVVAPPVIANGRVFTMDGQARITASDAATGERVWSVDLTPREGRDREAYGGGVAYQDGKLFVGSGFRFVAALNADTGAELWRFTTESPVHTAPTASTGRVFAIDTDNQLYALDQQNGQLAWSHQGLVEPARILASSSPAISGEAVIAPYSSGELTALRAANGNPLWSEALSRTNRTNALSEIRDISGRPVVYRGDVYAASHSGVFAAVDLRTGSRKWDLPVSSTATPWPAGDVVYVVSKAGELIAVNRDSGQVYWVKDLSSSRTRKEGGLWGIGDRTVRPTWQGPVLASGRLILVSSDGEAIALNPKTGEQSASLDLGRPAYLTPVAANGLLYVLLDDATLVAIR
jgi:outer membrane protein assembly factor BamB